MENRIEQLLIAFARDWSQCTEPDERSSVMQQVLDNLDQHFTSRSYLKERVEGMKVRCDIPGHTHHNEEKWLYNHALNDVLALLTEEATTGEPKENQ